MELGLFSLGVLRVVFLLIDSNLTSIMGFFNINRNSSLTQREVLHLWRSCKPSGQGLLEPFNRGTVEFVEACFKGACKPREQSTVALGKSKWRKAYNCFTTLAENFLYSVILFPYSRCKVSIIKYIELQAN